MSGPPRCKCRRKTFYFCDKLLQRRSVAFRSCPVVVAEVRIFATRRHAPAIVRDRRGRPRSQLGAPLSAWVPTRCLRFCPRHTPPCRLELAPNFADQALADRLLVP